MIQIEIDDSGVQALLGKLQQRIGDMTPAMQVIGEIVKTSVKKNFEVGGRYSEPGSWKGGTQRWQPLSLATLFAGKKSDFVTKSGRYRKGFMRQSKESSRHILIKERILMGSLNHQETANSVEVGTNVVYAAIHNFGGQAGRGRKVKIPARPFLVVQDEDIDEIGREILEHIMEAEL